MATTFENPTDLAIGLSGRLKTKATNKGISVPEDYSSMIGHCRFYGPTFTNNALTRKSEERRFLGLRPRVAINLKGCFVDGIPLYALQRYD